jgi:hypothetical protein
MINKMKIKCCVCFRDPIVSEIREYMLQEWTDRCSILMRLGDGREYEGFRNTNCRPLFHVYTNFCGMNLQRVMY